VKIAGLFIHGRISTQTNMDGLTATTATDLLVATGCATSETNWHRLRTVYCC